MDPAPDYARASRIIRDRTGSPRVYDPATEEQGQKEIAQFLNDGLTADEAVAVALLNNREFQAQFFELGISRADVVQSGLLTNPTLVFSVLVPEGGGRTKLTYGVAQELADLWHLPKLKKGAEERLESTMLNIVRAAVNIAARAKIAYYDALAARMAEENARENERITQEVVAFVRKRYDAGDVSELDVNRAQAGQLSATTDVIRAKQAVAGTRATLERELGLSYWGQPWELSDSLDTAAAPLKGDEELVAQAAECVLDVMIAKRNVEAAEADVESQLAMVLASVKTGVSAERPAQRAIPSRIEQGLASWNPSTLLDAAPTLVNPPQTPLERYQAVKSILPNFPTQHQRELSESQQIDLLWGPTLQVTLPLWDQNQARVATARYRLRQRLKEFESTLNVVAEIVKQKATNVRTGQELVLFYRDKAIPLAKQNAKGAERVYEAGQESLLSVLEAQRELSSLRKAYIGVLRDFQVAQAELAQAMGGQIAPKGSIQAPENEDANAE